MGHIRVGVDIVCQNKVGRMVTVNQTLNMITQEKMLKAITESMNTHKMKGHTMIARQATCWLDATHIVIFWVALCKTCGTVISANDLKTP